MNFCSKFAKFAAIALIEIVLVLTACGADSNYELKPINLPQASGPVALDYCTYDSATGKLWVPASNLGSVDVIDGKNDAVSQISGFKTGQVERRGRKVTLGPTLASIGDGVVYIGNRGDATLCVTGAQALERGECLSASPDHTITPDGLLYVAATKEVWITTRPVTAANTDAAKGVHVFDAAESASFEMENKNSTGRLGGRLCRR